MDGEPSFIVKPWENSKKSSAVPTYVHLFSLTVLKQSFLTTDINECQLGSFSCHAQARCLNVPGSYICICLPGFIGDGKSICQGKFAGMIRITPL